MFKNKKDIIYARPARESDVAELMNIEKKVWPPEMCATKEMLISRIHTFAEGFLCVLKEKSIQGFVCTEIIKYKDTKKNGFNWYSLTDNGFINKSHDPQGDSLYGISLSILPQSSKLIASSLLQGLGRLTILRKLKRIFFGARIPRYYKYSKQMSPREYIFTRTKKGFFLDPELAFYQSIGVYPVRLIKEYFHDDASLDYGVLVTWKNPYYKLTKITPSLTKLLSKSWRIKIYKSYQVFKIGKKEFTLIDAED